MTMTLATTPRRSERSFSHFTDDRILGEAHSSATLIERVSDRLAARDTESAEPLRSDAAHRLVDTSPLCIATAAELRHLRDLLRESVHVDSETGRNIGIKVQAFPLVNASSFAMECPLERIDRVHALIGTPWLNAFSFVQLLATQVRHYTESDPDLEQEIFSIWQQGSVLADMAEMLARMTGQGPSILSWLCGWVATVVEIDVRLRAHAATAGQSYASGSYQMSQRVIAGRFHQVVKALDGRQQIVIPEAPRRPAGPWSVVSGAGKLVHVERRLPLVAICLNDLPAISWPPSLGGCLAQKFAKQLPRSVDFAIRGWNNVQFSKHRMEY